jgi:beta-phosphoglucomutase-like phosphatase (HAD superfamily)
MLPKAILLDLDDTIVSYDGASDIAWQEMCDNFMAENK